MQKVGASSDTDPDLLDATGKRVAIVVAEWNREISEALLEGARDILFQQGVREADLLVERVPGSFEIPHRAHTVLEEETPDAVICLGSLIRGETIHFDVIAHSVASAIQDLNIRSSVPVLFGVLTDENMQQARSRAGGDNGNKGEEAAIAALRMMDRS